MLKSGEEISSNENKANMLKDDEQDMPVNWSAGKERRTRVYPETIVMTSKRGETKAIHETQFVFVYTSGVSNVSRIRQLAALLWTPSATCCPSLAPQGSRRLFMIS